MNKTYRLGVLYSLMMACLACGAEQSVQIKKEQKSNDSISTQTTPLIVANPLKKKHKDSSFVNLIVSKFSDSMSFASFGEISKKEFEQTRKGKKLSAQEVKLLTQKLASHWSMDFPRFYLKKFYEIDSTKQAGNYKSWLQTNGSEGNIVQVQAYANEKIDFYKDIVLLTWTLHHRTSDACPFAEGQVVFATIVYKEQLGDTFVIASRLSAGDAPISSETKIQTLLLGDAGMKLGYSKVVYEENILIDKKNKVCALRIKDGKVSFE